MPRSRIALFSPDLDGTLLGDPLARDRFSQLWAALDRGRRPLLVYNTGRTVNDTRNLIAARHLVLPDFIIGSLGTEISDLLYNRFNHLVPVPEARWHGPTIERVVAAFPEARPQPVANVNDRKLSWYWEHAKSAQLAELKARLSEAGVAAHVYYSCSYFLDIVPIWAGKGPALAQLCHRLQIAFRNVVVAGDSANDTSMFRLPGINGIVVQNALPELLSELHDVPFFAASLPMADGVIQGLEHFGIFEKARASSPLPSAEAERCGPTLTKMSDG